MPESSLHSLPPSPALPIRVLARRTAFANWWIPLALLLLIPLGQWVEGRSPFLGVTWDPFWTRISILLGINVTLAIGLQLINGIAGQFSLGHAGFMAVGAYVGGFAVTTFGNRTTADDDVIPWAQPGGVFVYLAVLFVVTLASLALLYLVYRVVLLTGRLHRLIPAGIVYLVLAWLAADLLLKGSSSQDADPLFAMRTLSAGVDAITGTYSYLLSHSSPLASFLTNCCPEFARKPLTFLVSLLGGGVAAALVGFLVGLPTLRLRGDYLAIATLGVSELIATAITNSEPLGRATGLSVPTYPADADPAAHTPAFHIFPWVYGVALLSTLLVHRLQRSPKGRALECLREDEIAANAVGINVTQHKVLAFILGAALAGVAGALFAHYDGYLNPKQFNMQRSIEIVVIVTLGGLGSIPGTLIACLLLTLFPPILQISDNLFPAWLPKDSAAYHVASTQPSAPGSLPILFLLRRIVQLLAEYRLVIYALLLISAMLIRSGNLFGQKKTSHR